MRCVAKRGVVAGAAMVAAAVAGGQEATQTERLEPDPLSMQDGAPVKDARAWTESRRPEVLELFRAHVYGRSPEPPPGRRFELRESADDALEGCARRKQVSVVFDEEGSLRMELLVYLPAEAAGPVPLFVGLNFFGNQSVHPDPDIRMASGWVPSRGEFGLVDHRATEASRGVRQSRWPIERILARGYGLATAYCGDLDPDWHDDFANGVHGLLDAGDEGEARAEDAWGTIGAWAWGLSRALDYFEQDADVDAARVAVIGHSRLGKTALWAGAQDERFALVISNNSGCGGAAYSRRRSGETVERINRVFPHWFCRKFRSYDDREDALPVDQHLLIALIAPRPAYVASAEQDAWADPAGEFTSLLGADPVYRLLGTEGLPVREMPGVGERALGTTAYHLRAGKHDLKWWDWEGYLDFADRHLKSR